MKKYLPIFFVALMSTNIQANECDLSHQPLGAQYTVSKAEQNNDGLETVLTLWRDEKKLSIVNENSHLTNYWEKVGANQLKLTRYFDEYERAIEYQPEDIKIADVDDYWSQLQHIISNKSLTSMEKISTSGSGCDLLETYVNGDDDGKLEVIWKPALQLPEQISYQQGNLHKVWQLAKIISSPETVEAAFTSRENYLSTDYADIGDNESDPFLIKMINLGHISHGVSGFYDEHGHNIGDGHHH